MSKLMWEPMQRAKKSLPDELKQIFRNRYQESPIDRILTTDDITYLRALIDARIKGAEELLHAMREHGEIHICEECEE